MPADFPDCLVTDFLTQPKGKLRLSETSLPAAFFLGVSAASGAFLALACLLAGDFLASSSSASGSSFSGSFSSAFRFRPLLATGFGDSSASGLDSSTFPLDVGSSTFSTSGSSVAFSPDFDLPYKS